VLSSGVLIAQLASFALTPVITRMYLPDTFGLMAFFLSIASPLTNISSFKYDQAILVADSEATVLRLSALAWRLNILFGLACAAVLTICRLIWDSFLGDLGVWLYLLPIFVMLSGQIRIGNSRCIREKRYKTLSAANVCGGLVTPLGRIICALAGSASMAGFILSQLISNIVNALILQRWRSAKRRFAGNISDLLDTARSHIDFPKYAMPNGLLFSLGNQMPVLMLGMLFEPEWVGYYALANRLIHMPVDLISQPIRQVFIQNIEEKVRRREPIGGMVGKLCVALALPLIVPFVLIELYGASIFGFVLGARWQPAGVVAGIVFPWMFMMFLINPLSSLYIVFRKQADWLKVQLILNIGLIGIFLYGHRAGATYHGLLWAISITNVIVYGFVLVHLLLLAQMYDRNTSLSANEEKRYELI